VVSPVIYLISAETTRGLAGDLPGLGETTRGLAVI
jgi:hypothetical protein